MPYFIINLEDRVRFKETGQVGVVIALGSTQNKLAHYLVRLDDDGGDIWLSRDEVVPETYQTKKDGD